MTFPLIIQFVVADKRDKRDKKEHDFFVKDKLVRRTFPSADLELILHL